MTHGDVLYVLDIVLVLPALWVVCWLIAGAVSLNGTTFRVGWPWCWMGLVWIAAVILRATGVIN